MALRLVEIIVPADRTDDVRESLADLPIDGEWQETLAGGRVSARMLLDAEETGHVVDVLDERFGQETGYQLLIIPVVAALPRPDEDEEDEEEEEEELVEKRPVAGGLSREELHHDFQDMTKLSRVYIATVVLSVAVAAVGMLRDNVAVIIGAMVIAPLLGPNVALAFATTIGDVSLIRRSIQTNLVGVLISLLLTIALGAVITVDPTDHHELIARTVVGLPDIVLAMAAGAVGALAVTRGIPAALVGVMVAVALLPPTVALGLMLGLGHWDLATGAAMLLAVNLICINLAGVVTFRLQGVRPRAWYDAVRARRSARLATIVWIVLLAALAAVIVLSKRE
ncbi:MAG: TIGR00341 family protein [Planctomycetes bacterium]|nr:TIGR00341 family protein [Planctomycetota bacterium]